MVAPRPRRLRTTRTARRKMETMNKIGDTALATGLVTSPWWADILGNINSLLTSATLMLGLVLGLLRVWFEIKKLLRSGGDDA